MVVGLFQGVSGVGNVGEAEVVQRCGPSSHYNATIIELHKIWQINLGLLF